MAKRKTEIEPMALNLTEAAQALGVSRPTFRDLIMPQLTVVRLPHRVLVPVAEIRRFLKAGKDIRPDSPVDVTHQ